MQIKGKILTIAGIVLIFGYFILDSFKSPQDATQVVMVGNDTLGKDWGALADQIERGKMQQEQVNNDGGTGTGNMSISSQNSKETNSLQNQDVDPFSREKFNKDNYSSIESPDGREIITDYSRQEQQEQDENDRYKSRHQKERSPLEEPEMIIRE